MSDYHSLGVQLRCRALTHADGEYFWPQWLIEDIFTELAKRKHANIEFARYRKVLANLALIKKENEISALIQERVNDETLPLTRGNDPRFHMIFRTPESTNPLSCFQGWEVHEREYFLKNQHRLNPVQLSFGGDGKTVKHEKYPPGTLLPFLEDTHSEQGGYCNVYKVKIHDRCHGFRGVLKSIETNNLFALKRISVSKNEEAKKEREFWKEVEALGRFNGFVHDHLVTLLMTWTINGQYCLLFPWAGCDLDTYFKEHSCPIIGVNPDIDTIRWVAKQMVGMAGALDAIHNPRYGAANLVPKQKYGRHGDIKLENVLWYPSPLDPRGIWVIADLGLTTINSTQSRSNAPGKTIPMTPEFRPPECDLEGGVISRSFDIWTFGCLLLEIVCWALGGQELRDRFEKDRTTPYITNVKSNIFFDVVVKEGDGRFAIGVKFEVSEWVSKLHRQPQCTEFFHDLLDLIEDKMIIPISATQERIKSTALHRRLEEMFRQAKLVTDSYCQYPCPKTLPAKHYEPVNATLNEHALMLIEKRRPKLGRHRGRTQKSISSRQLAAMGE
ncbi:kinase-like domain-containing protein [Phaeosphaeriaceae sp. PMI808]|nr:kinase-like domain-containing protein [Phaeosphaeriaceae sp. PMI808]